METIFLGSSIGILLLFLIIGFLCGIVRGLKRSSLHILVFLVSMTVALFITVPITNAILNVTVTIDGFTGPLKQQIIHHLSKRVDVQSLGSSMVAFIQGLPQAIVAPILFIVVSLVCYWIFDIIYLIVARVSFGKKKEDFKNNKPHRWFGGIVGAVEGFLFLFVLFAPLSALTKTYGQIVTVQAASTTQSTVAFADEKDKHLQTLPDMLSNILPKDVNEGIKAYNNSLLGKMCGAGGLDNALFDKLSNFKIDKQTISLRKELITLGSTYNNFVVVYNNFIDRNFDDLNLQALKTDIEAFLNNGIFKKVLTDTITNLVVNYDFKTDTLKLPAIAKDVLKDIKTTFTAQDFNAYEYLKHDVLTLVDAVDVLLQDEFIKQYTNLTDPTSAQTLTTVANNADGLKDVLDKLFEVNIIKDAFPAVINNVKSKLEEAAGDFVDLSQIENTSTAWQKEFDLLLDALKALNQGKVGDQQQTYLAYVLEDDLDMQVLVKEISKQKHVKAILDPVLSSKIFVKLTDQLFDAVDNEVEKITGVNPNTQTANLAENKDKVVTVIEKLIPFATDNEAAEELDLTKIGEILDAVASEAYNDGKTEKGTFNNIFCNLIWYLTGDDITADGAYADKTTTFERADEVKAILKCTKEEYYTADYKTLLANVQKVVSLAKKLSEKFPSTVQITTEADAQKLVADVKEVVNTLTKEEKLEVLQTMETVVDTLTDEYQIVPEDLSEELKTNILQQIDQNFGEDPDVAQSIKNLLRLTDNN